MIPSHLRVLPCGGCRNHTLTTSLLRVGNHFLCPNCRDSARATSADPLFSNSKTAPARVTVRDFLGRMRRGASLAFLAAAVTGFIVLPTFFDPEDLRNWDSSNTHASAKSNTLSQNRRAS